MGEEGLSVKHQYFILSLIFLVSCATPQSGRETSPRPQVTQADPFQNDTDMEVDGLPQDEMSFGMSTDRYEEDAEEFSQEIKDDQYFYGVWIDGAGYDSFSALGFLQTLEKKNIKPAFVVGTGMGCWVALSWALENNSNRAEWQAFKWKQWKGLDSSWLGSSKGDFTQYVNKILPATPKDSYALPFDCPLLSKNFGAKLKSSKHLRLADVLWYQMQIPSLGGNPQKASPSWYSGALAGKPTEAELGSFARNLIREKGTSEFKGKKFWGWIIVKTRQSGDLLGEQVWLREVIARLESNQIHDGMNRYGGRWMVVDLSDDRTRPSKEIKKAQNRRRWMLQGRRLAKEVVVNNGNQQVRLMDLLDRAVKE